MQILFYNYKCDQLVIDEFSAYIYILYANVKCMARALSMISKDNNNEKRAHSPVMNIYLYYFIRMYLCIL